MRYLSVCSGIEAATVAWHPLGWTPAAFSEIEPFPRAVLAHHYPDVPLHGDFTTIAGTEYGPVDLLVGGTPCQSFSVAGLRRGLADERGNLALEFLRLAQRTGARWLVWENVPGVLSSNGGRDFGAFLGGLVELGYGFAYRVLDAQYVRVDGYPRAVPQRRRRVFVVGCLGDWRRAAAVLFERESLSGHPAPRREAGQRPARGAESGFDVGGTIGPRVSRLTTDECINGAAIVAARDVAHALACHMVKGGDPTTDNYIASALPINTQIAMRSEALGESTGMGIGEPGDPAFTLHAAHHHAVAFDAYNHSEGPIAHALRSDAVCGGDYGGVRSGMAVRRLTPRECERLQGFRDDYTLVPYRVKPAADGPRYKALGNSMAVNCMSWIGQRIAAVEAITEQLKAGAA